MEKVAVVTDSTAYIHEEIRKQENIVMIPLRVLFGTASYREEVDISAAEFYEKMRIVEELPKTSQPAIGEFTALYEQLGQDHTDIIVITLSSAISGTYQAAQTAAADVRDVNVHVFDSEISSAPQAFYVLEAAKMAKAGQSAAAIVAHLNEVKARGVTSYFMVDNLTNLKLGGRLTGAQAFVGSLLQIKPVLKFEDKVIQPFEKIRTRKKALRRLFALFHDDAKGGDEIQATVIHANRDTDAAEMRRQLEQKYDNVTVDLSYFGPVLGTHLGEGAIGLTWYKPSPKET